MKRYLTSHPYEWEAAVHNSNASIPNRKPKTKKKRKKKIRTPVGLYEYQGEDHMERS
jgi:hypothetical protein